jgi:Uma2 family endonuclease
LVGDAFHVEIHMALGAPADPMSLTVDEFLALSLPDGKAELVRGELRMNPPPGAPHGVAGVNLVLALGLYVRERGLGRVFGDNFGYELVQLPHTVRVPDASFVRADRLPPEGVGPGVLKLAPDLAIEVLSPSETASQLEEKLDDYAFAGTPLMWVVDPDRRTVLVIATDTPVRWLREGVVLDGASVIPGFEIPVSAIFEGIARAARV